MLTKIKKSSLTLKNTKVLKMEKKWSGDMVDSYISIKFGIYSLDDF